MTLVQPTRSQKEIFNIFNQTWYFSTIKKYVSLFGTLFNDVVIIRQDADGKQQIIKVPIEYSAKEKMLTRVEADPDIDRPYSLLTPRLGFEMGSPYYDGTRKLNTINKVVKKLANDSNKLQYQYNPVAYNFPFSLYICAKNTEDGLKIVEQILPFFSPVWTTSVNIIPEMDITLDIPVTITAVNQEDRYSGPNQQRRIVVWTLNFLMRAWLWGPIKQTGIIKIANTSFYIANTTPIQDSVGKVEISERIVLWPGLDANGHPVNYSGTAPPPENLGSIAINEITADSDFGFIQTLESVPIGVPRPIDGANTAQSAQGWQDEGDGSI